MCTGLEVALVAGTAVSAGSSLFGGMAASQSAAMDARVAAINRVTLEKTADIQRIFADLSLRSAAADEARKRTEGATIIGEQRATYAANNLDPAFGAPLLLAGVTAAQIEVDAGLIRAQGQLDYASGLAQAASTQAGAASAAFQEAGAKMRSQDAIIAGVLGAGTAILGGVSRWPGLSGGGSAATVAPISASQSFHITAPSAPTVTGGGNWIVR